MTAEPPSIPVVDFTDWTSVAPLNQKRAIAQKLIEACRTVGFVYITNHHLSPERLAEAFQWSKKLFDLKLEQKMLAPHPSGFTVHRGYSWPGLEKVSNAMGDEDDKAGLTKNLRQVSDVKVRLHHVPRLTLALLAHVCSPPGRKVMKLAAKAIKTSRINGFLNKFFLASANS